MFSCSPSLPILFLSSLPASNRNRITDIFCLFLLSLSPILLLYYCSIFVVSFLLPYTPTTPHSLTSLRCGASLRSARRSQPWGHPSSPITIALLPSGVKVAFLARHGTAHSITPSEVPGLANIAALKSLGVRAIVAFSAVGSLREEIAPGDFVIPTSIIDRTKGIRESTYFSGTGIVAHAMFGDAFDNPLLDFIGPLVRNVLSSQPEGEQVKLHEGKTVVCMEGPQFSTRAESEMYRMWGGDIINMSVLPEAKLAREAEISYALICTSTDYDCWRVSEEPVTVA